MRKVLKWIGIVLGGLVGLLVLAVVAVVVYSNLRLNRNYDIEVESVPIPDSEAVLEHGEHLVEALAGCNGCHGDDLGGMVLLDDPAIMTFYGPNLTAGEGGAGASFGNEDWVRAIRHGVGTDGKPLLLMPAQHYRSLTDEDLGAILAYIDSLEPVDNAVPEPRLGPMSYVLLLSEPLFVPAELIDHDASGPVTDIEPSVTVEYGSYLVTIGTCRDCHGDDLNGRPLPPMLDEPPARNLTPGGQVGGWTEEQFIQTIRTGVNPGGHELQEPMAGVLKSLQLQSDDELAAILLYLQSLPALEAGY
jgi:mono/diheme cytochrome c family protein